MQPFCITRREFLKCSALLGAATTIPKCHLLGRSFQGEAPSVPLQQFGYSSVTLSSPRHQQQLQNTYAILMELSEDSLLKPFRQMGGLSAPGEDLGGWYIYKADYDYRKDSSGLAPGGTFGQWISARARTYAIDGERFSSCQSCEPRVEQDFRAAGTPQKPWPKDPHGLVPIHPLAKGFSLIFHRFHMSGPRLGEHGLNRMDAPGEH